MIVELLTNNIMKKFNLLMLLLFLGCCCFSQINIPNGYDGYFYAGGKPQFWQTDSSQANIIIQNVENIDSIANKLVSIFNDTTDDIEFSDEDDNIIIKSGNLKNFDIDSLIDIIEIQPGDISFFSYSKKVEASSILLRNEVLVKYKRGITVNISFLQNKLIDYNYTSLTYDTIHNEFSIICNNENDVMSIANLLYAPDSVIYSTPDFYSKIVLHTNDYYWNNQWNLNQSIFDNDINAVEAWNYINSIGGSLGGNVKVAVIDDGVEWHEDLGNCLLSGYTAGIGTGGSPIASSFHGQCCAGIIAAQHNNIGIAGIAPNCNIIPVRIGNTTSYFLNSKVSKAIRKSWQEFGADILSCSWEIRTCNSLVTNAIDDALDEGRNGKGCIVVFAAGNNNQNYIPRPQNENRSVIVVGASDTNGQKASFSNYGSELDVVAPGVMIPTIDRMLDNGYDNGNYTLIFEGTSASCPHVAAVAALMLSVNPKLSTEAVQTIICQTAKKCGGYTYTNKSAYPYGTHHQYTGYGLVDAYQAVKRAYQANPANNDLLYIKDCPNDLGIENTNSVCNYIIDESPDIWVRLNNDGLTNQYNDPNAFYYNISGNHTRYVYVRVRNKGSITSDGTGKVSLYWSKAAGIHYWPDNWNGSNSNGGFIGYKNLGYIASGNSRIYEFEWDVTNNFSDNWGKCLVARIENYLQDPTSDDYRMYAQAPLSNNVALHNCHFTVNAIPNTSSNSCGNNIYIGNYSDTVLNTDLIFQESAYTDLKGLTKECDVTLTFDSVAWQFMSQKFSDNDNFEIIKDGKVKILKDSVCIHNIQYPANTVFPMLVEFTFVASKLSYQKLFKYEIFESVIDSNQYYSGTHYYIEKKDSIKFSAKTDKIIKANSGSQISLSASIQNGNYTYNWYDKDHTLIASGATATVACPPETTEYQLEVLSDDYCFYDNATISIYVNQNFINSISPNPASTYIDVSYQLANTVNSATINIVNQLGIIVISQNLNVKQNSITIPVTRLQTGTYAVRLMVNNNISDSKNFVKQ